MAAKLRASIIIIDSFEDSSSGRQGQTNTAATETVSFGRAQQPGWSIIDNEDNRLRSTATTPAEEVAFAWDTGEFYEISFNVNRCRRYHAKMHAFYRGWHDGVMTSNALLGTTAFVWLIGGQGTLVATILTGIVAAASAIEKVLKPSDKARVHAELARKFTSLSADVLTYQPTLKNLQKVRAARVKIEIDEPPERRLIDLLAYNEEARSRGISDDHHWPLSPWQRRFGYCGNFGLKRLDDWHGSRGRISNDASHIETQIRLPD